MTGVAVQSCNNEQPLYDLFMQAPAAIAVLRGREQVFEFTNSLFLQMVGKTETIQGQPAKVALPELEGQGFHELMDKVYETGEAFVGDELPVDLDLDGSGVLTRNYMNFVYQPMRSTDGTVSGIMVHAVNVTTAVEAKLQSRDDEDRYQILFNSISQGFCVIKLLFDSKAVAQDYEFVEVNRVFEQQTGIRNGIGRTIRQIAPDIEPGWIKKYGQVALTGKPLQFVESSLALGRWFEVSATRIGKAEDRLVAVLFTDITERIQTQEALEQQLQTTRTITDIASSCLFMIDVQGCVTYMNPAAERVTGYKLRNCLGKAMHDLIHHSYPDGSPYPEADCPMVKTYTSGLSSSIHEDVFYRKDGSSFPALSSGTPILGKTGVQSTVVEFRDITTEKKAIQTLADSEARLRFMSESMPQKVFTATADGRMDYFNNEWMEYTGLTLPDIISGGWTKFMHPDDIRVTLKSWKQALRSGEAFEIEHRFRRADGAYHSHLSRARPMRGSDGVIIRWFGSNTDIEEIKSTVQRANELEESTLLLKEQRAQLVALNDAKDDFIALASHQLRTPATAVKQYLGLVLDGFSEPLTESQTNFIKTAYDSNERQLNIITDLLRTAKLDSSRYTLRKQHVSISAIITEAIADMQPILAIKDQKIRYKAIDEAFLSLLDGNEIKLVFMNLLENASKYSYPHTTISVHIRKTRKSIRIDFSDAGVGITKDDTVRIFDKFTRINNDLSDTVTGTGLGLYWVNKIVKLHNGSIEVKSELGKGSTFTVHLPL